MQTLERFGKFRVLKSIAQGGMAEVFLAETEMLSGIRKRCALKRIREPFGNDRSFVSRFIDEARITIGLEHENIVALYDFGQVDGHYFIAMEFIEGKDLAMVLRQVIEEGRSVVPEAAATIARMLLNALAYAHDARDSHGRSLQIVHRDVSPQNVLISNDGRVKLTDFGVANARNKLTTTMPGMVVGKSAYMSPEQARAKEIDGRTDVWATGVLLHEMLSGQRLFAKPNATETLAAVLHQDVEKPSNLRLDIPEVLDAITLKALSRPLEGRYKDALQMRDALDAYLAEKNYGAKEFQAFVSKEFNRQTARKPEVPVVITRHLMPAPEEQTEEANDAQVIALVEKMRLRPDVWRLIDIGLLMQESQPKRALAAFRCAAAVFAYRGALVQCAAAHAHCRRLQSEEDEHRELMWLGDLNPGDRGELTALIEKLECGDMWELLCAVDPHGLGNPKRKADTSERTPLLSYLGPREFADVASAAVLRRFKNGEVIMREGEKGDSVCAIAHGKVVVYCHPRDLEAPDWGLDEPDEHDDTAVEVDIANDATSLGMRSPDRAYLSALSAGDFFGEFSFLTERPRSATVETITRGSLLEFPGDVLKRTDDERDLQAPFKRFYRERVVELMMAKNPVFSRLSLEERRTLLESMELVRFEDEDLIIAQGASSDCMYFIRKGEAEVFRTSSEGLPIFINKLGQGQFFGEVGVLRNTPRSESVRAMGACVLYRVPKGPMLSMIENTPELSRLLERMIIGRTQQSERAVREFSRIVLRI